MTRTQTHAAARRYAERYGWHVFPLHAIRGSRIAPCTCRKPACGNVGKHPRWDDRLNLTRGCLDATIDLDLIDRWWTRWPDANVGIATGRHSGLLVVDVDTKRDADGRTGLDTIEWLQQRHGVLDDTLWAKTGSGGYHAYLRHPAGETLGNTTGQLGHGVDTRACGGYVVAPPSIHESGHRYEWQIRKPPAACPDWIVERLRPEPVDVPDRVDWTDRRDPGRNIRGIVDAVAATPKGNRNAMVFWGAKTLAAEHVPAGTVTVDDVYVLMRHAAEANGHAARHTARQVDATIASGIRHGLAGAAALAVPA